MADVIIAAAVGLAIGVTFRLVRLPIPVPHGWGGIAGLVSMFVGSIVVSALR